MRNFADGVDITRRCWDVSKVLDGDKGVGESVSRGEENESDKGSIFDASAGGDESDKGGGRVRFVSRGRRVWSSIVFDFFRNVNLPLSTLLGFFTSEIGPVSTFPGGITLSPNSELRAVGDDDAVVDVIVVERESRRT